jgi:hypothetical protein
MRRAAFIGLAFSFMLAGCSSATSASGGATAEQPVKSAIDLPGGVNLSCDAETGANGFIYAVYSNSTDRNWNVDATVDVMQKGEVIASPSYTVVLPPAQGSNVVPTDATFQVRYPDSDVSCTVTAATAS